MTIPEIDVAELARRCTQPDLILIDVREPHEYEAGHVPGAVLVPLAEVPQRVDEIPTEGTVHLICARGGRSLRAAEWLAQTGRTVVNVAGGTTAWIEAGQPVVTGPTAG